MVPQASPPSNDPLPQTEQLSLPDGDATVVASLAAPLRELLRHPPAGWPLAGWQPLPASDEAATRFAGRLGNQDAVLTWFRQSNLASRALAKLCGGRGQRSYRLLQLAQADGLPVVVPLAHGRLGSEDCSYSFLITAEPAAAVAFAWTASQPALAATGRLLRQLHDRGQFQALQRPADLLVLSNGEPCCRRIAAYRRGEPSLARRACSLALFCADLPGGPLDRAAAPFLRAYAAAGPALPVGYAAALRLAVQRQQAAALRRDGRRHARGAASVREAGCRWTYGTAAVDDAALRAACTDLLAKTGAPGAAAAPCKSGRRGGVWLQNGLAMKQRSAAAARQLWHAIGWLQSAGVATPPGIAMLRHRGKGYVFTRRIPALDLAARFASSPPSATEAAAVAAALGSEVGRLHAHGLRNRDLKFDNLVQHPADGRVYLVDLDGIRSKSCADARGIGADLGRLLAAFRSVGSPGGQACRRAFLRSWLRAHRRLLQQPPLRRILRRAEQRAAEWAATHRNPG